MRYANGSLKAAAPHGVDRLATFSKPIDQIFHLFPASGTACYESPHQAGRWSPRRSHPQASRCEISPSSLRCANGSLKPAAPHGVDRLAISSKPVRQFFHDFPKSRSPMKALIKLGGALLDDAAARKRLAVEIAAVHASGLELVLVHGGGKQMTRFLAGQGIESQFVNGLRVTSPEVLDAVVKVVAGSVNKQLVAELTAAGVRAAGLSGLDGLITEAEQLDPFLGFVGKPVRANPELLQLLTANGYLPVIACVAGDRSGQIFNVNADQMATACAAAFEADLLLFLTDVPGVRGA
ncbi:MAG: acetylglutamate kinase, partial [Gammaproteobacteria bacterium]